MTMTTTSTQHKTHARSGPAARPKVQFFNPCGACACCKPLRCGGKLVFKQFFFLFLDIQILAPQYDVYHKNSQLYSAAADDDGTLI